MWRLQWEGRWGHSAVTRQWLLTSPACHCCCCCCCRHSQRAEAVIALSTFSHCSRQGSQFMDDFLIPAGWFCECRRQQDSLLRFFLIPMSICLVKFLSPHYLLMSLVVFPVLEKAYKVSLKQGSALKNFTACLDFQGNEINSLCPIVSHKLAFYKFCNGWLK